MSEQELLLQSLLQEAKHELLSTEKRSRILIEKSVDMLTLASPDGKMIYASPSMTNILGYTFEEILEIPAVELIHPEDLQGLSECIVQILTIPGQSFFRQHRVLHKDGRWIWCEGSITNMLDEPGIHALVSNFRDISDRKAAEEKLKNSEKKFRAFFENAPEGIIIFDVNSFKFVKCNANALKFFKLPLEELLSKSPLDLSPEFQPDGRSSSEKVSELIQGALNGEKLVFEWQVINGLEEEVTFEVRLVVVADVEVPQLYASFVDITERKRIETRLKEQNQQLSDISFLQSHQVRQPIASILGLINLFDFKKLDSPLNAEIIMRLQSVTKRFDEIIQEIVIKTVEINKASENDELEMFR